MFRQRRFEQSGLSGCNVVSKGERNHHCVRVLSAVKLSDFRLRFASSGFTRDQMTRKERFEATGAGVVAGYGLPVRSKSESVC